VWPQHPSLSHAVAEGILRVIDEPRAALHCTALHCSVGSAFLAVEEGGPAPPEGSLAGFVGAPGTSTALIDNSADVRRAKYAVDAADYKQTLLRQMEVRFTVSFVRIVFASLCCRLLQPVALVNRQH
jgi:hypothetical protein